MKIKNILKPLIKGTMFVLRVFPIKENKVVFSAFSARTYGDNPRFIAEKIIEIGLPIDCVFVLKDPDNFQLPDGIRKVKYNTISYLYEMVTACIWVDNTRKQPYIVKRHGQTYIQTWHGGISFKMVEKDVESSLDKEYVKTAISDSKKIDYLLTNSLWGEKQLRRCFWYDGKIICTGSARLDLLFSQTITEKKELKKTFGMEFEEHVLLYAPTFRKDKRLDVYDIDYINLISALKKRFGGDWKILLKLHPNISNLKCNLPESVIDVTLYPDINQLYGIADVLITDYSSSIFDFSILKKPAFIYAKDIKEYSQDRNTYFDIKKLPFILAENNKELVNIIEKFDEKQYRIELERFHDK